MKAKVVDRGIISKISQYGESSLILKVFARDHGLISVIAKGIRKKPECSLLAALGIYEFTLYEPGEGELYLLSEFSLQEARDFSTRMQCWSAAECALEMIGQILIPSEENPQFFELLPVYLEYLDRQTHNAILIWWRFLLRLFQLLGIPFQTNCCSLCHQDEQTPAAWDLGSGALICRDCYSGPDLGAVEPLTADCAQVIALLPVIGNYLQTLTLSRDCVRQIDLIFAAHYQSCFHKPLKLKSLGVLEQFYPN